MDRDHCHHVRPWHADADRVEGSECRPDKPCSHQHPVLCTAGPGRAANPQHDCGTTTSRASNVKQWCPAMAQAIIGNYAVPILEEKQVWGTNDQTRTAYLDTTDVARMALASLRCEPRR